VDTDEVARLAGLTRAEADAALAELLRAQDRAYYDAEADAAAAAAYYGGVAPEQFAELMTRTHGRRPAYKPARELYPWVDLQPSGRIRSLYTGQEWQPEELIRADLAIAETRAAQLTTRLAAADDADADEVAGVVEAALPFNCEHVVPQSWFAKKEPMRGDLHHLFACESRCNSFRGNTPYAEFADFPAASDDPVLDVIRGDCGKSTATGFEPVHGKGAAARAAFYFLLRYPGQVQPEEMPPDRLEVLLAWHEAQPVSEWERHRNAAIAERQGNRNCFIDHPALAGSLVPVTAPSGSGRHR